MAITSILVANRGEIACRIMRTVRSLGLRSIAVFSDADAGAPHVAMADDAVWIGPSPVGESYLCIEKLLAAAHTSKADAIHPGYGFLSENDAFAAAVTAAGLCFLGPPAEAIRAMGNKAEAKRRMRAAKVPCVPGYEGQEQSDEDATSDPCSREWQCVACRGPTRNPSGLGRSHVYAPRAREYVAIMSLGLMWVLSTLVLCARESKESSNIHWILMGPLSPTYIFQKKLPQQG